MPFISTFLSDKYRIDLGRGPNTTHVDDEGLERWVGDYRVHRDNGDTFDEAMTKINADINVIVGLPADTWPEGWRPAAPIPPPTGVIAGRLRAVNGHLQNDAGPFMWHGLSEFNLVHLARTGAQNTVIARLDNAAAYRRNVVRVFAMAKNLFDLHPEQDGYWSAAEFVAREAAARGIYVELCLLPDAQLIYPGDDDLANVGDCEWVVGEWLGRYGNEPVWVWQASNEARQNGFTGSLDPNLLNIGQQMAELLGHKDFSIDDAPDGDDADASQSTIDESVELARHCNLIVLHGSRKGGAEPDAEGRLRRWADHLEAFIDVMAECRKANPNAAGIHDEPHGHAAIRYVPLPGGKTYEREYYAEAALMAAATCAVCRLGMTYHRIATQDPGTPGLDLIRDLIVPWPATADYRYANDSWQDSPTKGFTGFAKVRSMTNGQEAYTIASGVSKGTITWANSYQPEQCLFNGANVELWKSRRS